MQESSQIIIDARNLCKQVTSGNDSITILQNVNLQVRTGEHIAITGPSGSGKTTLLSLLATLDYPTSGKIYLGGIDITALDEEQRTKIRAQSIGFVFQNFHLLPNLSALENITLPLDLKGIVNTKKIAQQWLEKVDLSHRANHYPSTLSGGEMQRVAVARAFALKPSLLFVDEPTGNLDESNAEHITKLLFSSHQAKKTTLILVTHDKKLAAHCQHTYRLSSGKLT